MMPLWLQSIGREVLYAIMILPFALFFLGSLRRR